MSIARGYELAVKAMITLTLPVAILFFVFADELIEFLYGPEFEGAVSQLRWLAIMTVLYGLNAVATTVLDRPRSSPGASRSPRPRSWSSPLR